MSLKVQGPPKLSRKILTFDCFEGSGRLLTILHRISRNLSNFQLQRCCWKTFSQSGLLFLFQVCQKSSNCILVKTYSVKIFKGLIALHVRYAIPRLLPLLDQLLVLVMEHQLLPQLTLVRTKFLVLVICRVFKCQKMLFPAKLSLQFIKRYFKN